MDLDRHIERYLATKSSRRRKRPDPICAGCHAFGHYLGGQEHAHLLSPKHSLPSHPQKTLCVLGILCGLKSAIDHLGPSIGEVSCRARADPAIHLRKEPAMPRPVTLFTGQWADLPF